MVSIGDAPEIVYTNDKAIDRLFSYLNEGDIQEIVERSLEADTTDKGGGLSKILSLKYSRSSTDEDESEFVRKFDSVGKFAVLHGALQDDEDITFFEELDESERRDLEGGDFVQARGEIRGSPINDIQGKFAEFKPYLDIFDFDMEFEAEGQTFSFTDLQDVFNELDSGEDIYTVGSTNDSMDADVVFSLPEGALAEEVSEYTEYNVLGRVEHVYSRGEEEWLMNMMDLLPGNNRETRNNRRRFLKQMVSGASKLLDRNVTEDDFKIGYPDVRIRPVAIYLM